MRRVVAYDVVTATSTHRKHRKYSDLAIEIGKLVRAGREAQGWDLGEMASRFGVTKQTVSNWELGVNLPRADALITMSRLFGFSVDGLRGDAKPVDLTTPPHVEHEDGQLS